MEPEATRRRIIRVRIQSTQLMTQPVEGSALDSIGEEIWDSLAVEVISKVLKMSSIPFKMSGDMRFWEKELLVAVQFCVPVQKSCNLFL